MEPGQEPEPGGGWFHFNPLDIEDIAGPVLPERRRGEDDVAERANGRCCRSCGTLSWVTRPLRDGLDLRVGDGATPLPYLPMAAHPVVMAVWAP